MVSPTRVYIDEKEKHENRARAIEMAIIGKFVQATYPTAFQIYQLNVLTINFPSLLVVGNGSKKSFSAPKCCKIMFTKAIWAFLTFWRQICFKNLFLIQFAPCRQWSNFGEELWKFIVGKQPTYDLTVNLLEIQLKNFYFTKKKFIILNFSC